MVCTLDDDFIDTTQAYVNTGLAIKVPSLFGSNILQICTYDRKDV